MVSRVPKKNKISKENEIEDLKESSKIMSFE